MRARYPDSDGFVERDGVRIFYEVFGSGEPTALLLSPWSLVYSRFWKAQVPYLARYGRVITLDGRGSGHSSRPVGPDAYADVEFAADAMAVLDAVGCEQAYIVSISRGARWALLLAAEYPERVHGAVFIAPALPLPPFGTARDTAHASFDEPYATTEEWAKWNRHYWLDHYADFVEFFCRQIFTEPHSTKQIEDCVGWALETTPEILIPTVTAPDKTCDANAVRALAEKVHCPVMVIHGDEDAVVPYARGQMLADLTGGRLCTIHGGGHAPIARDPVKVNLLLRSSSSPSRRAR